MTPNFQIDDFLTRFDQLPSDPAAVDDEAGELFEWCREADDDDLYDLLGRLSQRPRPSPTQDALLSNLFRALAARDWSEEVQPPARFPDWVVGQVAALYQWLGPRCRSRDHLCQLIATHGDRELAHLVEWLLAEPPITARSVLITFAPLFQRHDFDTQYLFPRLLDAVAHPLMAASVVDLANFVTSEGLADPHPAKERVSRFVGLLGEITHRLAQLEESVGASGKPSAELAEMVEDGVSLAVALCHGLALIGDEAAVGKLFQTLELRHRRLRTEAAAALAALQQPAGVEALAALASEPVVRLRVLTYADELDCLDEIDEQYRTAQSIAESELAIWLAQPSQMGMPPSSMECVDSKTMYWPGYDDEVDCFLFRFSYQFTEGAFSNIGIAGPLAHAFSADIADLPPDDIYAAFAGWQAEHEDIYEIEVVEAHEAHQSDIARFERRLRDEGYENVRPLRLGFFFGDRALLARAARSGTDGIAVVDLDSVQWRSTANSVRPVGPDEVYSIYKGRKLLRSFND